jgi:hypothetical protein
MEGTILLGWTKIKQNGTWKKSGFKTKNLERELDWVRQGAKGRQTEKHVYRITIKCWMKIKSIRRKLEIYILMVHV